MIERNDGRIRAVAWTEICPWLVIFRSFRLAIRARFLLISAVAILAMATGWDVIGRAFTPLDDPQLQESIAAVSPPGGCAWLAIERMVPDAPGYPSQQAGNIVTLAWTQLTAPFQRLFNPQASFVEFVFWLACGLWAVFVWSFAGGALTRTAAVALAAEENLSWTSMCSYVLRRWGSYFAAPLFPFLGVLLVAIPTLIVALLLRTAATAWLAGLFWFLPLAGGLLSAVLMLGLLFGWPLMWATISSEGSDSFDALSRCYAYVFQRPLHYLFYAVIAAILGGLGWLLVMNFAAGVVYLAYWSASWGAGNEAVTAIAAGDASAVAGAGILRFWTGCVKILAVGYLYSYFWTAAVAVYLVLRRNVDATEMDEVFLEEDPEAAAACGLPPVGVDEQGAPVVEDEAAADQPAAEQPATDDDEKKCDSQQAQPGDEPSERQDSADQSDS